jgi:3-hydroxyisobutyrate dehydrogenase-like beta-hydroxyacid dehydrogenase
MAKRQLGFLGLGSMGGGMVGSLLRAGFPVVAYDPVTQLLQAAVREGAASAGSPEEVAARSDIVLASLPMPADVENAVAGERGVVRGLRQGAVFIDLSSIDPGTSRRMHSVIAAAGGRMLDCPVGKGPKEAASGDLTLMIGGEAALIEEVRDVLEALGSQLYHCGPAGSGAAAKVVNNLVSCSICALNSEALVLATKAGVDLDTMIGIMKTTAADNRHLHITAEPLTLEGNFAPRFKLALAHKDLRLAVQTGLELGVPLALAEAAHLVHTIAIGQGLAEEDQGAVIKVVEQAAGAKARSAVR